MLDSKIEFITDQQLIALQNLKGLPNDTRDQISEIIKSRDTPSEPSVTYNRLNPGIMLTAFILPFLAHAILLFQLFTSHIVLYKKSHFQKFWLIVSMGYCMWFTFVLLICKYYLPHHVFS